MTADGRKIWSESKVGYGTAFPVVYTASNELEFKKSVYESLLCMADPLF